MDIFIYFQSALPQGRDVFEDAIDDCLGEWGSVSGGGSGAKGANIDVRISDPLAKRSDILLRLRDVLRRLQAPRDTIIDVDGDRFRLDS